MTRPGHRVGRLDDDTRTDRCLKPSTGASHPLNQRRHRALSLAHVPEKWEPVFRIEHAQNQRGTRIIELLVVLQFRSSYLKVPRVLTNFGIRTTRCRLLPPPAPMKTASPARAAPICCSTSTIRSTGGRGAPRRWRKPSAPTSRSCSRSAMPPATGATSWRTRASRMTATAAVMNDLFVNIKVDREERPDIDQIYMSALHHLGEHGGWPLTMFLTPDGEPFWGGTYFPKTSRYGKPAFVDVLREVERVFRQEPQSVEQNRSALMARLAETARPKGKRGDRLRRARPRRQSDRRHDRSGRTAACAARRNSRSRMMLEFLWRAGRRTERPALFRRGRAHARRASARAASTITSAAASRAIRSTSAGSCRISRRCSTTTRSCSSCSRSPWQRSANDLFRTRARETVGWLAREMTTEGGRLLRLARRRLRRRGGQVLRLVARRDRAVLGQDDAAFFAAHYDVTAEGNFEGHNILNRLKHLPRSMEPTRQRLAPLRAKLLEARGQAGAARARRQGAWRTGTG